MSLMAEAVTTQTLWPERQVEDVILSTADFGIRFSQPEAQ